MHIQSLRAAVIAIAILVSGCSADAPADKADLDDLQISSPPADHGRVLDQYLATRVDSGFSGVALVNVNGKTILHEAYGPAGNPINRDSCFWIASISKMFSSVTAVLLHENGQLDLRAPITTYLDNVPGDKTRITLHHLLTHTSGLGSNYVAEGITDRAQAERAILTTPLVHPIGDAYLYSGDAYNLAAIIIEAVAKKSFEQVVRDNILAPMSLTSTGFWGFPIDAASCTMAPYEKGAGFSESMSSANYGFRGATGMRSSAGDLLRWYRGLFNDAVTSARVRELIFTPYVEKRPQVAYGYGWNIVKTSRGTRMLAHTGLDDLISHVSYLYAFPDEKAVLILLSNSPMAVSNETLTGMRRILFTQAQ